MSLIDEFAALIESYPANRWYREGHTALEAMQAEIDRLRDLPRLIELQRDAGPEDGYDLGWNAGLEKAAEIARASLQGDGE